MFKLKIHISFEKIFIALFLFVIIFGLIGNFLWSTGNTSIEDYFSNEGLLFSIEFFYKMQDIIDNFSLASWQKFYGVFRLLYTPVEHSSGVWPQFVYLTTSLFYLLLGNTLLAAKLSMLPYLLILALSVFFIGKKVSSILGGVVAACLTFMYPLVFESGRQYGIYFTLTALVSLSILVLLECDNFRSRKYSFFLGIVVGIGMLIRGQLLFFIGIPLLYSMLNAVKIYKNRFISLDNSPSRHILGNISIFLSVSILIGYFWWGKYLILTAHYLKMFILDPYMWRLSVSTGEDRYSLATITWYLKDMYSSSISPLFVILFLPAVYKLIREKMTEKYIFFIWLMIPLLMFSFIFSPKYTDYIMPILPAVSILTSWWLVNMRKEKVKIIILFAIAVYSITQFYCLTFAGRDLRGGVEGENKLFGGTLFGDIKRKQDFKFDEVTSIFREYIPGNTEIKILSISLTKERPRDLEILYWLRLKDRNINAVDFVQMYRYTYDNFKSMDFVILKVPEGDVLLTLPAKGKFVEMLKESNISIEYINRFRNPIWNNLIDKFCRSYDGYKFVARIPTSLGYSWLIFRKFLN